MRRPPARRPRLVAGALTVAAAAGATSCIDDGPALVTAPHVVAVAAQPCDRPLPSEGIGVVVADGTVVTAGHVVEGSRRRVDVDGAPATVVAVDARTDLAVLRADVGGRAHLVDAPTGEVRVVTPGGPLAAELVRTGPLVVHDTTDGARYERAAHTFRPAVGGGTSGAPLVDADGRVVGIVVLANRTDGTSYAVTGSEVAAVVLASEEAARHARGGRPAAVPCPG